MFLKAFSVSSNEALGVYSLYLGTLILETAKKANTRMTDIDAAPGVLFAHTEEGKERHELLGYTNTSRTRPKEQNPLVMERRSSGGRSQPSGVEEAR